MTKSYIYTDKSRILAQRNGGQAAAEYFYVTDRLGSVRQLIDDTGSVVRNYTYSPFGQLLEEGSAGGAPARPCVKNVEPHRGLRPQQHTLFCTRKPVLSSLVSFVKKEYFQVCFLVSPDF